MWGGVKVGGGWQLWLVEVAALVGGGGSYGGWRVAAMVGGGGSYGGWRWQLWWVVPIRKCW